MIISVCDAIRESGSTSASQGMTENFSILIMATPCFANNEVITALDGMFSNLSEDRYRQGTAT
jgi:hypothetical protein